MSRNKYASRFTSTFSARERISHEASFHLIRPRPEDQFIISYPRSGTTWLRTMITNVLVPDARGNPDVFNTVIPGVTIRKIWQIRRTKARRLLSSHTWYRPCIQRAIYLVRQGKDSLVSYYHFLTTRRGRDVPFEEFFNDYVKGRYGQTWYNNVESWLDAGARSLGQDLLVIQFEKMKKEPERHIERALRFLEISFDAASIERALEYSSIDHMAKVERSRRGETYETNGSFYRGGRTGQWQELMTSSQIEEFDRLGTRAHELLAALDDRV